MVHDRELLDYLDSLPTERFDGEAFRATRRKLDAVAASYNGGRWMLPDSAAILYTSLDRDGALAEIAFHWRTLTPLPTKSVSLHRMRISCGKVLRIKESHLASLGVSAAAYREINPPRTQEIGAAITFLGYGGLIAPSARWKCDNLMLFPDSMGDAVLEVLGTEEVDWQEWARSVDLKR